MIDEKEMRFSGRVALQQRVLPHYRAAFIDRLAAACKGGLSVFAGDPLPVEGIAPVGQLETARHVHARNLSFRDPSSTFFLCWQEGILRWLRTEEPDVLIVEANPRYPSTRLAIRWMHARNRPVIGWGLGAPDLTGSWVGMRRRERRLLLRKLDGIIAYSHTGADQYRREYLAMGMPEQKVYTAGNAVTGRPSSPMPERPPVFQGKPTVLFVGRLQERKLIDNLLLACAQLRAQIQPHLVIVGDGPARRGFEEIARNVYPAAEFTGEKHADELEGYFRRADLFVLPGTGGLAVQQAMAFGLPVIVAEGDGTQSELVRPGNGWEIPPGDTGALRQALDEALVDPGRLREMGMESYRIVSEEVNIERMAAVFLEALQSLSGG